jgi:hypothetical protein
MIDGKINPDAVDNIWIYLLRDSSGVVHTDYQLTHQMNSLIDNMKANVHKATLNQLADDELVQFSGTMLGAELKTSIGEAYPFEDKLPASIKVKVDANKAAGKKTYFGDLTVEEMIQYVDTLFTVIAEVEADLDVLFP